MWREPGRLAPHPRQEANITAEELGHVELVSNGIAMLANGPDSDLDESDGGDISGAPFEAMKDIRSFSSFAAHGGGAVPVNSNSMS
jgi:Mn-containing catalase